MLTTTTTRRAGTSGSVAPTCAALIRYRTQQNRTFRFARIWASYLDSESHREVFRHHRKLRHKYAETLNRRLSWDNHPYAEDAKRMLKSSIRNCWWKGLPSAARCVNTGARHKTPDNPTGIRPGNNIEDAERGAMEHLLFGNSTEDWPWNTPKSRGRTRNQHTPSRASAAVAAEDQNIEVEYTIDPITNRKVPITRKTSSVPNVSSPAIYSAFDWTLHSAADIPGPTHKAYEPQFTPFNPPPISDSQEPIFYDGPPPEAELKKYGPVRLDPAASRSAYDDQPNPVLESDEYENSHAKPSENPVSWHSNDGIMPTATSGADGVDARAAKPDSFGYDDLEKYIGMTPTRKQPYDDLQKYKPVALEEDDVETLQSPQQYSDLSSYDTFSYLEPDGSPVAQEDTDTNPDVHEYQQFQEDARAVYDEPRAHPAELGNYKPFGYNEPDGKPMLVTEEPNDYDPQEVQQYEAFRYNEPDGKPEPAAEEGNDYDPSEVQRYQAFRFNEPDGKPLLVQDTDGYEAAGLQQYQEISFAKVDADVAKPSSEAGVSELRQYGSLRHNEPDGKQTAQPDSTAQSLDEFDRKQRTGSQIPYIEPTEEERAEDLDLLRASDVRASFARLSDAESAEPESQSRDVLESWMSRHAATSDVVDKEAAASVKEAKRRSLEAKAHEPEQGRQLTGNYVRDFPDEFAGSWTATFSPEQSTSSNISADETHVQPALDRQNKQEPLQPALDRQSKLAPEPAVGDLFSKEPQGLETSYARECAAAVDSPIFVKQYGDIGIQPESPAAVTAAESATSASGTIPEPTLYKILAYDQTMQTINMAETTSNVSKTEPPLTPAEVLLRLSNPAKFFPHFGPLQAQGFEIVSGSGDVLVFRKVRDAEAGSIVSSRPEPAPPAAAAAPTKAPLVNPIDMTGSKRRFPDPAIGRFASPTGFVNYDMPAVQQQQQQGDSARRFVSGIDVRREEAVFSGERKEGGRGTGTGTKSSLSKRMAVGAAWVAGVSYALGVMGEYFKTGGADGMGPKGF